MGRFNMPHPEIDIVTPELLANQSSFQSVYHSTEKLKYRNLDSDGIRKCQRLLILQLNETVIKETLAILSVITNYEKASDACKHAISASFTEGHTHVWYSNNMDRYYGIDVEYVNGLQMWKFIGLPGKIWWGPCRWMAGLIKSGRLTRRPDLPGC
jgi:hypothetical protein